MEENYILATAYEFCVANQKNLRLSRDALKSGCVVPVANKLVVEINAGNGIYYKDIPEEFFKPTSPVAAAPLATAAAQSPVKSAKDMDPVVKPVQSQPVQQQRETQAKREQPIIAPVIEPVVAAVVEPVVRAVEAVVAPVVSPAAVAQTQQQQQQQAQKPAAPEVQAPVFPPGKNLMVEPGTSLVHVSLSSIDHYI